MPNDGSHRCQCLSLGLTQVVEASSRRACAIEICADASRRTSPDALRGSTLQGSRCFSSAYEVSRIIAIGLVELELEVQGGPS